MNKISLFRSRLLMGVLVLSIVGTIASCKKDDAVSLPQGDGGPQIIGESSTIGKIAGVVGDTVLIYPKLSSRKGVTYFWAVNGTTVSGNDSIFKYVPTAKGTVTISYMAKTSSGSATFNYVITAADRYENGFYIINEGWFGHGTGGVNFYRYGAAGIEDSVYLRANPGLNLNPLSSTLEFGTIFNNQLYLVSKAGGPVVVTDANSLKEAARIPAAGGNNYYAFVGVDNTHGLLSSTSGIYPLSLPSLSVGAAITGVTGVVGDMIKSGNYIFALSQSRGVVILNAADYSVVKTIAGMAVGFARTKDGTVWAAGGTSLLQINPNTLDTATIPLPFTAYGSWGAWHPGSITASTSENAIFLAKNGSWSGGTTVYKYVVGNAASLNAPFVTVASGKELYGSGIGYDAAHNQLITTTVQSGYGNNFAVNDLLFYDAGTGAKISDIAYSGYYFPAMLVFH